MATGDGGNVWDSNLPTLLFQNIDIDVSVHQESWQGTTTLWLAFKQPVKEGDTFYLHSRQHKITEIRVNGTSTSFARRDGLRNFNVDKQKPLLGEELDLLQRAALEISRQGELEIRVPNLDNPRFEAPRPIPQSAPEEVRRRFDKITKTYRAFSTSARPNPLETMVSAYGVTPEDEAFMRAQEAAQSGVHFLQVRIRFGFLVEGNATQTGGIVFRRQDRFSKALFNYFAGHGCKLPSTGDAKNKSKSNLSGAVQCVYTTNHLHGQSMYDVDGIRCWLPCLDSLDQRAVFDLHLSVAKGFHVVSAGKRLAPVRHGVKAPAGRALHRFFTPYRIPAMQLGFFLGRVESYRMDLMKGAKARIWVARGLQDLYYRPSPPADDPPPRPTTTEPASGGALGALSPRQLSGGAEPDPRLKRALESFVSKDQQQSKSTATIASSADTDSNKEAQSSGGEPPAKRMRSNSGSYVTTTASGNNNSEGPDKFLPPEPPRSTSSGIGTGTGSGTGHGTSPESAPPRTSSKPTTSSHVNHNQSQEDDRRLYFDAIHHTFLTFDVAVHLLHKFTGHTLHVDEIAFVFVSDLGTDFMPFEGLVLIDQRFLHEIPQVFQESATHLLLLEAYLYSWLRSVVPIASYAYECLLHGLVGYLLKVYVTEVFGADEGQVYLQRVKDAVVALEKAGFGGSLVSLYPESTQLFSRSFGQYVKYRSTLFLSYLELKIGGQDAMRLAFKEWIRAPLLFKETVVKGYPRQFASNSAESTPVITAAARNSPYSPAQTEDLSPRSHHSGGVGGAGSPAFLGAQTPSLLATGERSIDYRTTAGGGGGVTPYNPLSSHFVPGETPYRPAYTNTQSTTTATATAAAAAAGDLSPYVSNDRLLRGMSSVVRSSGGELSPLSPYSSSLVRGSSRRRRQDSDTSPPWSPSLSPDSLSPPHLSRQASSTSQEDEDLLSQPPLLVESMMNRLLTLEGFLHVLREVSDSIVVLEDDLFDRLVTPRGVGLYQVKVKYHADHKKIVVRTEQVLCDRAGQLQPTNRHLALREQMKILVMEECDGVLSKLDIAFDATPQVHEKAAFTRPGRRKERILMQKDPNLRGALDIVRSAENPYPVKYAALNPVDSLMSDVLWVSNDSQLIEMLHADCSELGPVYSAHRQWLRLQAMRSLSCVISNQDSKLSSTTASTMADAAATGVTISADGQTAAGAVSGTTASVRLGERSAELEVLVLTEIILNSTRDCRTLDYPLPLRVEAVYGLARWQNNHAPAAMVDTITVEEDGSSNGNNWPGMEALLQCLFELYTDTDTQTILPPHLHDEASMALRSALLLALSSLRSQRGYTPPEVIDTLLLFAEYLEDEHSSSAAVSTSTGESHLRLDDTHYRATLFLALSQLRFSRLVLTDVQHPIYRIVALAKAAIRRAFGEAKVEARIRFDTQFVTPKGGFSDELFITSTAGEDHNHHRSTTTAASGAWQAVPRLAHNGVEVAAALTCLSEMDVQVIQAIGSGRGRPNEAMYRADLVPKASRHMPLPCGALSQVNYLRFCLPPSHKVYCVDSEKDRDEPVSFLSSFGESASSFSSSAGLSAEQRAFFASYDHFLCTPLIRAVAFESFVRNALAMHIACTSLAVQERQFAQYGADGTPAVPPPPSALYFGAAVIETLDALVTQDNSYFTRREAAETLTHLVLGRPPRIVLSYLTQQDVLHSLGVRDPCALTLWQPRPDFAPPPASFPPVSSSSSSSLLQEDVNFTSLSSAQHLTLASAVVALRVTGRAMHTAVSTWQRLIARTTGAHQGLRVALLRAWLACFGANRRPPSEITGAAAAAVEESSAKLLQLYEAFPVDCRDPLNLIVTVPRLLDDAQRLGMRSLDEERHRARRSSVPSTSSAVAAAATSSVTLPVAAASRVMASPPPSQQQKTSGLKLSLGRPAGGAK